MQHAAGKEREGIVPNAFRGEAIGRCYRREMLVQGISTPHCRPQLTRHEG
jgi:hypothetical protein